MQAVILAAGRGSRLGEGVPKCLVELGGRALIEHQLAALRSVGIRETLVVVGYGAERVRARLGSACHFVENERFDETNSLYSLWLACGWVRGPFLQLNCDLVAHPEIYARLLAAPRTALAYDSGSGDSEEHMKVVIQDGVLLDIGKEIAPQRSCGENLGLLKHDERAARLLFEAAGRLLAAGHERAWSPAAVAELARRVPVRCVDVAGLPWTEIDFVEDVLYARCEVWPELVGVGERRAAPGLPRLGARLLHALTSLGGLLEHPN